NVRAPVSLSTTTTGIDGVTIPAIAPTAPTSWQGRSETSPRSRIHSASATLRASRSNRSAPTRPPRTGPTTSSRAIGGPACRNVRWSTLSQISCAGRTPIETAAVVSSAWRAAPPPSGRSGGKRLNLEQQPWVDECRDLDERARRPRPAEPAVTRCSQLGEPVQGRHEHRDLDQLLTARSRCGQRGVDRSEHVLALFGQSAANDVSLPVERDLS